MLRTTPAPRRALIGLLAVLTLAGCQLPRSGPTTAEILAGADAEVGGILIVGVNESIARASNFIEPLRFDQDFLSAGVVSAEIISPGDVLSVSVWENVDTGLLAGVGQRVTVLQEIQVDQSGRMFVPYAGRIEAVGRTPEQIRQIITSALEGQTPDPQVEVRRASGDGSTVTLAGAVAGQGVYPIEQPTRRLSSMLAAAGGVAIEPDVAQIRVLRGGRTGRIWLQDLYEDPSVDIALRAGDRIIVEADQRSFTALGATGGQARVPFTKRDLSALEALAEAGGLNPAAADPRGLFIFRTERPEIARAVTGRTDLQGPQRMAYVIDLTSTEGLFAARTFQIRDQDTLYATEAPFAAWTRVLQATSTVVQFAGTAASVAELGN